MYRSKDNGTDRYRYGSRISTSIPFFVISCRRMRDQPSIFLSSFFLLPSSLPPSAPYFIVSRALCPLKRPDYKRPINSFILFAPPFPFLARSQKSSVVIPVRTRFFFTSPFSSIPATAVRSRFIYFMRCGFGHIAVN